MCMFSGWFVEIVASSFYFPYLDLGVKRIKPTNSAAYVGEKFDGRRRRRGDGGGNCYLGAKYGDYLWQRKTFRGGKGRAMHKNILIYPQK